MNILVISGSRREGNNTQRAAKLITSRLAARDDVEHKVIYASDVDLNGDFASIAEQSKWADGFIIATPEYNHSFSGELKIMLDFGGGEWMHKPVVPCGVSSGGFGGTRAIQSLNTVLIELGMIVSSYFINISKAGDAIDDSGQVVGDGGSMTENIDKSIDDLLLLADKMAG